MKYFRAASFSSTTCTLTVQAENAGKIKSANCTQTHWFSSENKLKQFFHFPILENHQDMSLHLSGQTLHLVKSCQELYKRIKFCFNPIECGGLQT